MDFAIYGIAFNIGKMWNKVQKMKKNAKVSSKNRFIFLILAFIKKCTLTRKFTGQSKETSLCAA